MTDSPTTWRWFIWRDDVRHGEAEPWAVEATNPDVPRQWFATWQQAWDHITHQENR